MKQMSLKVSYIFSPSPLLFFSFEEKYNDNWRNKLFGLKKSDLSPNQASKLLFDSLIHF